MRGLKMRVLLLSKCCWTRESLLPSSEYKRDIRIWEFHEKALASKYVFRFSSSHLAVFLSNGETKHAVFREITFLTWHARGNM